MGIGNLGLTEILIIAVIVLVFFGPRRLPEIGRSVGKALREFKRGMNEIQRELEDVERGVRDPDRDIDGRRGDARDTPGEDGPAAAGADTRAESGSGEPDDSRSEARSDPGSDRGGPGEGEAGET